MGNIIVPDDEAMHIARVALACEKKLKLDEDKIKLTELEEEIKTYFSVFSRKTFAGYRTGSEYKIVSANGAIYMCSAGSTAQWVVDEKDVRRIAMNAKHNQEKIDSGLAEMTERDPYLRYDWKTRLKEQSSAKV